MRHAGRAGPLKRTINFGENALGEMHMEQDWRIAASGLVAALLTTAALVPIVRRLAISLRAVDEPGARRVNVRRVPRLGGLALVFGFFVPLAAMIRFDGRLAGVFFEQASLLLGMGGGAVILASLGAADDIVGISATTKLVVQLIAAAVAYAAGFQIHAVFVPGLGTVSLGAFAFPLTLLWITGVVNALNLIDGLDGLAAGVAFFACVTNFTVAWQAGDVQTCLLAATLGGALLGFLFYNFNPATIFMGDSGSMFLGFVLATMSLAGGGAYKGSTTIALIVPLVALGVPIMDMFVAMGRRVAARRSVFSPDRGHIHHRLLDAGLTHRRAVLILYGLCIAFTIGALAIHMGRSWPIGLSLLVLVASVVAVTRFAGYFSRALLGRESAARANEPDVERLRRHIPAAIVRLNDVAHSDDLLKALETFAIEAELLAVQLVPNTDTTEARAWRWEAPHATAQALRESVHTTFHPAVPGGTFVLTFAWDCAESKVSAKSQILLQVLGDQIEQVLQRVFRTSVASREQMSAERRRLRLAE